MSNEPELLPGMLVMVRHGATTAEIHGHLPVVAIGCIRSVEDDGHVWIQVWLGSAEPVLQLYDPRQILGVPCAGLRYDPVEP